MTFWQENYAFIKDIYDNRASRMTELMDKTDKAMAAIKADKIYTSAEFKRLKENFLSLARNLEQPDVKDWLNETKDCLMGEKSGKEKDEEGKKLTAFINRFDEMQVKVEDTKNVVDTLWKSYQFTDELAPLMEFLEDCIAKSTRTINTNSAAQTEEIQEKQDKNVDQLDKRKKIFSEAKVKGEKILANPRAPKFLQSHLDKLDAMWAEANKVADERIKALKDNLVAWERYERERDALAEKLAAANSEYNDIKKVFSLETAPLVHAEKVQEASATRKGIESSFAAMAAAYETLAELLEDGKKAELGDEVENIKAQLDIMNKTDEKLKEIDEFNKELKLFNSHLKELEDWLPKGRQGMDELLKPSKPMDPQDRVTATMELQSEVMNQCEMFRTQWQKWDEYLKPTAGGENTDDAKAFMKRLKTVESTQDQLSEEVKAEGAKFGDDVKYLAEFTAGCKKFQPWIQASEAKKAAGMTKPKNLEEALDLLEATKKWKEETETMKAILDESYASAQKMTLHDEPDLKFAAFKGRWETIHATVNDWIQKLESMVTVWQKQADTAAKVTAAISAKPGAEGGGVQEMKLEDLEKHLDALKAMFIEKQKMMEELEKSNAAANVTEPAAAEPPSKTTA